MRVSLPRTALAAAGAALLAAASLPRRPVAEDLPAWSVQLHLHGSFSEGLGSLDSHGFEAAGVGADVLWWSDHDYRIVSYHMPDTFSFDAVSEPMHAREAWEPVARWEEQRTKWVYDLVTNSKREGGFEIVADAREGEGALRVRAAHAAPAFRTYALGLASSGSSFVRPLAADLTLELSVRAEALGPDARAVIAVDLSEHAPTDGRAVEQHTLRYVLGTEEREPERRGNELDVFRRVPPGEWTRVSLPLTRDVAAGFPEVVGEDNSMHKLALGVESRAGAEASVLFDDLRLLRGRPPGAMYARQRELIAEVGARYEGLVQLQGAEISYASLHLNEFSVDTALLDYDRVLAELDAEVAELDRRQLAGHLARRLVADVHARGGLVSYNHPYGAAWTKHGLDTPRREVLRELVEEGAFGVDLLEVGYRARGGTGLEDHLWLWDELALAGLPLVGTGVSDSHGGPRGRWRGGENNFLSWIFAPEPTKAALIEGLRAGRVFFGDPVGFDGRLDLVADRGFAMGRVVVTDRAEAEVELQAEGVKATDAVRLVVSGEERHRRAAGSAEVRARHVVPLAPDAPTVVRFEVLRRERPRVLSNPIVYVRAVPARPVARERLGLDLAGVVARDLSGVALRAARADGEAAVLELAAEGGALELELAEGDGRGVTLGPGLEGAWSRDGDRLRVRGLAGRGELRVE